MDEGVSMQRVAAPRGEAGSPLSRLQAGTRSRGAPAVVALAAEQAVVREPVRAPHDLRRSTNIGDRIFDALTTAAAVAVIAVLVTVVAVLVWQGRTSIASFGLGFVTSSTWDPIHNVFGAAPAIGGTIYTSLFALLLAGPVGVMVAIYLSEMAPRSIRFPLGFVVELLAAVPSIVFGLWALFVLVPLVSTYIEPPILDHFGNFPLFSGTPVGLGYFPAILILAVMILPTITSVSRDALQAIPNSQRDAMLALGATRWETIWKAVVPAARSGIIGGIILGLGRAIGETMAVQMVIGNAVSQFSVSLFAFGTTMPATLVNQFQEATGPTYRSALIEIALILMLIAVALNAVARLLVWRVTRVGQ